MGADLCPAGGSAPRRDGEEMIGIQPATPAGAGGGILIAMDRRMQAEMNSFDPKGLPLSRVCRHTDETVSKTRVRQGATDMRRL